MVTLKISRDFTEYPGARYYTDGPKSGQAFFDECLKVAFKEALQKKEKLVVDLDDTAGYASSFLSESFGLLSEEYGASNVLSVIEIISRDEPDWKERILKEYIPKAYKRNTRGIATA